MEAAKRIRWPGQVRSYVHGTGQCVGLMVGKKGPVVHGQTVEMNEFTRMVNRSIGEWCRDHAPPGFGWTSLQINVGTTADWHYDHRNLGPSCLAVVGRHVGGELEVKGYRPKRLINQATMFNGKEWHRSLPVWEGDRVSFVAFIHEGILEATEEDKTKLRDLGFVLPSLSLYKAFQKSDTKMGATARPKSKGPAV